MTVIAARKRTAFARGGQASQMNRRIGLFGISVPAIALRLSGC